MSHLLIPLLSLSSIVSGSLIQILANELALKKPTFQGCNNIQNTVQLISIVQLVVSSVFLAVYLLYFILKKLEAKFITFKIEDHPNTTRYIIYFLCLFNISMNLWYILQQESIGVCYYNQVLDNQMTSLYASWANIGFSLIVAGIVFYNSRKETFDIPKECPTISEFGERFTKKFKNIRAAEVSIRDKLPKLKTDKDGCKVKEDSSEYLEIKQNLSDIRENLSLY